MDDTVFDMFQEIADAPGEIYDIPEMTDRKFDVEDYINGDTDYWYLRCQVLSKTINYSPTVYFTFLRYYVPRNDAWSSVSC